MQDQRSVPHEADPDTVLAIDIGGTKMASAIMSSDGTLSARSQCPTRGVDAEDLFAQLCSVVEVTLAEHRERGGPDPSAIGVGCGGPMSLGGTTVTPLNIPQWHAFPLRERLRDRFALVTEVDNDAKALALGEGHFGAARGERNYLAMVVSTGIGAGVVVDGKLLDGASGNAGHIGHVVVVPDGRSCVCGSRGCLEAEASGTAIAAITGQPAANGDAQVRHRTGTLVGRAVAALVVTCDLRLGCVGGSVALGYADAFFAAANTELQRIATIGYAQGARIVPVGLGADGPLIGAGCVARRALGLLR